MKDSKDKTTVILIIAVVLILAIALGDPTKLFGDPAVTESTIFLPPPDQLGLLSQPGAGLFCLPPMIFLVVFTILYDRRKK